MNLIVSGFKATYSNFQHKGGVYSTTWAPSAKGTFKIIYNTMFRAYKATETKEINA